MHEPPPQTPLVVHGVPICVPPTHCLLVQVPPGQFASLVQMLLALEPPAQRLLPEFDGSMTHASVLTELPSSHSSPVSFTPLPQDPGDVQVQSAHVHALSDPLTQPPPGQSSDVLATLFALHSRRRFCSGVGQKLPQMPAQSLSAVHDVPGLLVQEPPLHAPEGHCAFVSQPVFAASLQYPLNSSNPPSQISAALTTPSPHRGPAP